MFNLVREYYFYYDFLLSSGYDLFDLSEEVSSLKAKSLGASHDGFVRSDFLFKDFRIKVALNTGLAFENKNALLYFLENYLLVFSFFLPSTGRLDIARHLLEKGTEYFLFNYLFDFSGFSEILFNLPALRRLRRRFKSAVYNFSSSRFASFLAFQRPIFFSTLVFGEVRRYFLKFVNKMKIELLIPTAFSVLNKLFCLVFINK